MYRQVSKSWASAASKGILVRGVHRLSLVLLQNISATRSKGILNCHLLFFRKRQPFFWHEIFLVILPITPLCHHVKTTLRAGECVYTFFWNFFFVKTMYCCCRFIIDCNDYTVSHSNNFFTRVNFFVFREIFIICVLMFTGNFWHEFVGMFC